jgi:arabinofuranosyltransferase
VVLAVAVALCLATRIYFILALPYCAEDAYITFRYALNWAHGLGPVYNAGEKAWGFTSPLWTSYLALTALMGIPLELAARWTLVGCDVLVLWLGWRLLLRQSFAAATAFALFFALWPRLAHMPASGLESSLVVCLLLATASLAKSRFGGALNGILALSRPEGAAMSLLMAWLLNRKQRLVWLAVAALNGTFMLYFGQLLPSSVASKASVYGIQLLKGVYWLEWLIPGMAARTDDGIALAPISVLLLAGLVAIVARWRRAAPEDPALPLLLGCGLLTLYGYMVLGVPWYFWYAPPPMIGILLVCFLGLGTLGLLRWVWVPITMFLVFSWFTVSARVVRVQTHDAAVFAGLGETLRRDAAGRPSSVILEPIGIIGFMSGLRVIDEVGLVTPWVARERERGDGWYARVIAKETPDYVVIRRDWLTGRVSWAGAGAPFTSREQADAAMVSYEPLRWRASQELPEGAGRLLILRRRR